MKRWKLGMLLVVGGLFLQCGPVLAEDSASSTGCTTGSG